MSDPFELHDAEQLELKTKTAADNKRKQADEDLRFVLSSGQGRRVLYDIISGCGIYHSSFSTDALQMAFKEGRRNEGLKLITKIDAVSPGAYSKMIEEQRNAS